MGHMFADVLKPEVQLCRFDLVLPSDLLALGELLAQVPQIQFDRFEGVDALRSSPGEAGLPPLPRSTVLFEVVRSWRVERSSQSANCSMRAV